MGQADPRPGRFDQGAPAAPIVHLAPNIVPPDENNDSRPFKIDLDSAVDRPSLPISRWRGDPPISPEAHVGL
jgi:hypothetical protein